MKRIWILAAGIILGTPLRSSAGEVKQETPPKVEESTRDSDKAAVHDASSEADQWAAKNAKKDVPAAAPKPVKETTPPVPAEAPKPVEVETPKAAKVETNKPVAAPVTHRTGLNEMKGKFQSKSYDPKTVRLIVDGGYNVEFSYDGKTTLINGGSPITIDDLEYNDEVIIRYSGKDLYALEIDRVSKAPRPQ